MAVVVPGPGGLPGQVDSQAAAEDAAAAWMRTWGEHDVAPVQGNTWVQVRSAGSLALVRFGGSPVDVADMVMLALEEIPAPQLLCFTDLPYADAVVAAAEERSISLFHVERSGALRGANRSADALLGEGQPFAPDPAPEPVPQVPESAAVAPGPAAVVPEAAAVVPEAVEVEVRAIGQVEPQGPGSGVSVPQTPVAPVPPTAPPGPEPSPADPVGDWAARSVSASTRLMGGAGHVSLSDRLGGVTPRANLTPDEIFPQVERSGYTPGFARADEADEVATDTAGGWFGRRKPARSRPTSIVLPGQVPGATGRTVGSRRALDARRRLIDSDLPPADSVPELVPFIQAGDRAGAIRMYRAVVGCSVTDATDALDALDGPF